MRQLHETIRQKRTELWKNQSWIFHYDNATAHISMLVCEFLAKNKTVIMSQPPSSSNLAPADFFLFAKPKTPMKGKRLATIEEIKEKIETIAAGHTKKLVSEMFRGLEKTLA